MRRKTLRPLCCVAVSALAALSLISCSENAPPAGPGAGASADNRLTADAGPRPQLPAPPGGPVAPSAQTAGGAVAGAQRQGTDPAYDTPVPPRDAQWTLLAYTYREKTHVSEMNRLKQTLIDRTHRHDWYVIHGRDESNLYFGFYRAIEDEKDPASAVAQADKLMVRGLKLKDTWGQDFLPFKDAGFMPLSAPDPAAPPEWNLFNKDLAKNPKDPTRAFWSIQVMAFKANPLRKEAAVQAVENYRKQGIEAYYYHGETISSVCVGAWPMDAIEPQENHGDHTIAPWDKTLLVLPGEDAEKFKPVKRDDLGNEVVTVAPVLKIRDPGMKAMKEKFNFEDVNYYRQGVWGRDGKFHQFPSFVVVIPRAKGNGFYDSNEWSGSDVAVGGGGAARPGGAAGNGAEGVQTNWFNAPSSGAAGTAAAASPASPTSPQSPGSAGSAYGRPRGPSGTYGASLPPAPSDPATAGVGHLRRVGE